MVSWACRLNGSKMPKMSLSVIAVRLPLGVGRERGRFFLRVDVSMVGLEARNADAVNVRPCRALRRPATQCDSMFTRSNFITCRGRRGGPRFVAACRGYGAQARRIRPKGRRSYEILARGDGSPCDERLSWAHVFARHGIRLAPRFHEA